MHACMQEGWQAVEGAPCSSASGRSDWGRRNAPGSRHPPAATRERQCERQRSTSVYLLCTVYMRQVYADIHICAWEHFAEIATSMRPNLKMICAVCCVLQRCIERAGALQLQGLASGLGHRAGGHPHAGMVRPKIAVPAAAASEEASLQPVVLTDQADIHFQT